MSEVNLHVNGRSYGVSCDDGQEERVLQLGNYIDEHVREIASGGAAATESHLLVLASLLLADEVFDSREKIKVLESASPNARIKGEVFSDDEASQIKDSLARLSLRINSVAERMEEL